MKYFGISILKEAPHSLDVMPNFDQRMAFLNFMFPKLFPH